MPSIESRTGIAILLSLTAGILLYNTAPQPPTAGDNKHISTLTGILRYNTANRPPTAGIAQPSAAGADDIHRLPAWAIANHILLLHVFLQATAPALMGLWAALHLTDGWSRRSVPPRRFLLASLYTAVADFSLCLALETWLAALAIRLGFLEHRAQHSLSLWSFETWAFVVAVLVALQASLGGLHLNLADDGGLAEVLRGHLPWAAPGHWKSQLPTLSEKQPDGYVASVANGIVAASDDQDMQMAEIGGAVVAVLILGLGVCVILSFGILSLFTVQYFGLGGGYGPVGLFRM